MTRREEDVAKTMFTCSTHDYVMFFTTRGRTYRLKGYEVPEGSRNSKGMNIVNLLPLEAGEKVSAMIRVPEYDPDAFLCMVTRKGIIKRTSLDAYRNVRKNGVIAINLDDDDELAWVRLTSGNDDLLIATRKGMGIRFNENDARPLGRTARGVKRSSCARATRSSAWKCSTMQRLSSQSVPPATADAATFGLQTPVERRQRVR